MVNFIRTVLVVVVGSIALTGCLEFLNAPSQQGGEGEITAPISYGPPEWATVTPGRVSCAKNKFYTIVRVKVGDYMDINWEGRHYTLVHIPTTTGTYRYEDSVSGLVIVQIPEKAQLLNTKLGQRLADECNQ